MGAASAGNSAPAQPSGTPFVRAGSIILASPYLTLPSEVRAGLLATGRFLTAVPDLGIEIFHGRTGAQGLACRTAHGPRASGNGCRSEESHAQPRREAFH